MVALPVSEGNQMTTDLDRLRTDAIIAIHKASEYDFSKFIKAIDKDNLSKRIWLL